MYFSIDQVGSDDDGYAVRLKFAHFLEYLRDPEHSLDDSPLYIFDGSFADRCSIEVLPPILYEYDEHFCRGSVDFDCPGDLEALFDQDSPVQPRIL